jgi:hypothetical protein
MAFSKSNYNTKMLKHICRETCSIQNKTGYQDFGTPAVILERQMKKATQNVLPTCSET